MKAHTKRIFRAARMLIPALITCVFLLGCDEYPPTSKEIYSMNLDGSALKTESLQSYGVFEKSPMLFYLSDDLILYSNTLGIYKGKIGAAPSRILTYENTTNLDYSIALDEAKQKLYYNDRDGIFECDFAGENKRLLKAKEVYGFNHLSLSEDKNYLVCSEELTAYDGQISRINLQNGDIDSFTVPHLPVKVWYHAAQDRYIGCSNTRISMYWYENGDVHYSQPIPKPVDFSSSSKIGKILDHSADMRYFAIQNENHYNLPYLMIYDILENRFEEVGYCGSFSFLPGENRFIASRKIHNTYDVRLYDCDSWATDGQMDYELLFDGIFKDKSYLYPLSKIFPRFDKERIVFTAELAKKRIYDR